MADLFSELNDAAYFSKFVRSHLETAPAEIAKHMKCANKVDEERLAYAHKEYVQDIGKFSLLLHSSNPDHYKRAGALLHALYQSKPIVDIDTSYCAEDVASGLSMVPFQESKALAPFLEFYEAFYNPMLAFDLAYKCCAAYEDAPVRYDFDYLHNMCHFLGTNNNLGLDTCFMLFRSLMLS